MYVKICGITTIDAARDALDAGADAIGVVFSPGSKRDLAPAKAAEIFTFAGSAADRVVVVNKMAALDAARLAIEVGGDVLQLHGPRYAVTDFEQAAGILPRIWRAISWRDYAGEPVGSMHEETLLLDAPDPGSGIAWDLSPLAAAAPAGDWMLAGGLTPANVAAAIETTGPWGVDVSSGVEASPGVKDPALVRAFIAAARAAAQ
ncbi:phosphoribosylanthranilate isomerase [Microbacterium sp. H1-D42]|uniref:phosphoribosylanthranilate isomerase n=1 Tax=Microbacterium sp. H1-D42 TaxID=2925844 RepID=UPI001F53036E|nr:phosphoribosylanthranilate isomerase [Microbacterium sp. H1-D42]UNK71228.1 phosphoribosylanthranilate isomerase [Microbacterium sp. H1-D42]